jgi:hypothetical protein
MLEYVVVAFYQSRQVKKEGIPVGRRLSFILYQTAYYRLAAQIGLEGRQGSLSRL